MNKLQKPRKVFGRLVTAKEPSGPLTKPAAPGLTATRDGVTVGFLDVSPKLATAWLKHNVKNRTLKEDTANGYARDCRAGNWLLTHQGVAFNDRHELIDGQHRLEAVIRAGTTITLMASFGYPAEIKDREISARDVVDAGAPRTIANILELHHDMKRARMMASAATQIGNLCYPGRLRKATLPQILGILEFYRREIESAFERRGDLRTLWGAGLIAALAFASPAHPAEVEDFQRRLNTGANLGGDSPVLQLRNFLVSHDSQALVKGTLSARLSLAELCLQQIYLFIEDRRCGKLQHSTEGADYFRAKQKETVATIRERFELPMYYRQSATGPKIPPPSDKETAYQKLRGEMGIKREAEEVEP